MNNEVTFSVKIIETDTPGLKTVTVDANQLGQALDGVSDKSKKFNGRLLDLNQITQASQNLFMGLQQLVGVTQEFTDKYAQKEVADTKLLTVMRQRMSAQAEDVQSIKAVISAQKDLGVISGTVQTSGAQQMATFLNQRSSLETLIPAMNNLVAQQNGLNATQEDAVGIGNMMGKAMQGQAEVLQRVGITFTDAQKQVLKYGTEEQRAATLAQVIKDNVGDMNAELAKTDAGQAKKTAMQFDSVRTSIGAAMSSIQPFLAGFSQFGMVFFTITQIKNGFEGVVKATSLATIATTANSAATKICTAVQNTHKAAMVSLTAATGSATVAAVALTAAYTMGLSLAITGIVLLVEKLCGGEDKTAKSTAEMSQAAQDAKQRQDELNSTMSNARAELSIMTEKLKDFHGTKQQEKKLVQECNSKYGEAMGYYGSVSDWYKVLANNSQVYCAQMVNEVRIRQLANQAAVAEQKAHDIKYNADGTTKKYSTHRKQKAEIGQSGGTLGTGLTYKEVVGSSASEKANAAYTQNLRESVSAQRQMNDLTKENIGLSAQLHKGVKGTTQYGSADGVADAEKVKTDKNTSDKDVLRANAESYTDLSRNLDIYQKKLDATKPSEIEKIKTLTEQIRTTKAAQEQVKALQAEYAKPAALTTLEDYSDEISRQQTLLKTAGEDERKTITATIEDLEKKKKEMERAAETAPVVNEIKSYEELNDAISYYTERLNTADAAGRKAAQAQLNMLTDMKDLWEEADAAANKPAGIEKLTTMKQLDSAISYYTQLMQIQNADEISGTQSTIDALQRKKQALLEISNIKQGQTDLDELGGLNNKELKIKLDVIGLDGIKGKIQSLQKLLKNTNLSGGQSGDIQKQISQWTAYENKLKKSQATFKKSWSGIKDISSGIKSLTTALKGNGSAWDKITSVIDAAIQIFEGVNAIIEIVRALTAATTIEQSAQAATQMATNSTEGATWTALAATKTAAAYADIPFAGPGLAVAAMGVYEGMILAAAVPKFANGGVAYGPTLGLFGEYANAATNPEIVAPLDRLRDIIGGGNDGGGKVEFKIKGRRLVGVLEKEGRRRSRG